MREFTTGATRDKDDDKLDYEGFLSPLVLEQYAYYMHANRMQADGKLRASDNWQKGIPREAYMKSGWRHFMELWKAWRTRDSDTALLHACSALLFNIMGFMHETIKKRDAEYRAQTSFAPINFTLEEWY
jgi:hypothetical protein